MNNLKRTTLTLLGLVFLALAGILIEQNYQPPVDAVAFGWEGPLPLGAAMGICGLLTGLGALLLMWARMLAVQKQHFKANRELERKEVSREEASEKVKVLENKVATLEKALDAALKQGQPQK